MPHLGSHLTVLINNATAAILYWSCNSVLYHFHFWLLTHIATQYQDSIQRLDELVLFCFTTVLSSFGIWVSHVELCIKKGLLSPSITVTCEQPAPCYIVHSTPPHQHYWLKWPIVQKQYCLLRSMGNYIINQAAVCKWVTSVSESSKHV